MNAYPPYTLDFVVFVVILFITLIAYAIYSYKTIRKHRAALIDHKNTILELNKIIITVQQDNIRYMQESNKQIVKLSNKLSDINIKLGYFTKDTDS